MHFAHPEYWPWLAAAFVAAVALCVYGSCMKRRQISKIASSSFLKIIAPDYNPRLQTVRTLLFLAGFALLLFSAAGPQWGRRPVSENLKGLEIFIAIDCSQSMAAEDYKPSRLAFSKSLLVRLTDLLSGNKIGIIAYAGDAFLECPLTTDYDAAKLFIDYADYSIMPVQGTNISKPIDLALGAFSKNSRAGRAIVLLTDGESFEGDAYAAAERAAKENVPVFTIGVGSPEGTEFTIDGETKRDRSGRPVVSKLDEDFLKKLASITGGLYVHAGYDPGSLNELVSSIKGLKKGDIGVRSEDMYISRFQYSLIPAFVFLFVSFILGERRIFGK